MERCITGKARSTLAERPSSLSGGMSARIEKAKGEIGEYANRVREKSRAMAQRVRRKARERVHRMRQRAQRTQNQARQVAHEKPFHVLAGVGLAALALGAGLRIWRSA
jgi:ElaB/YqjD/DUF883 family membrane-anchored ribosome-binding protein